MNGKLLQAFRMGKVDEVLKFTKNLPGLTKNRVLSAIKLSETTITKRKINPLAAAIEIGDYQLTKLLVEDGAPLNFNCNIPYFQPLSLALMGKKYEIAEFLIQSGANVNKVEFEGSYPIFWAISYSHISIIIELIISAGFSVNSLVQTKPVKLRPIHVAVMRNNIEAAKALIKYSVDLDVLSSDGETAMDMAAQMNEPEMVKFLVNHGAKINCKGASSCPLFYAIRHKHLHMVELLLELGANMEEGWETNRTISPLQFAISYILDVDIIMLIIARGANVNGRKSGNKKTPLHCASIYLGDEPISVSTKHERQCTVAKALLDKGADPNAKDKKGRTPLDSAILNENLELCKLLLTEGAEIFGKSTIITKGTNRFAYILQNKILATPELIRLCLERGADYSYELPSGLPLYDFVVQNLSHAVVKMFRQFGIPLDVTKHGSDENPFSRLLQLYFIDGIVSGDFEKVKSCIEQKFEPKGCCVHVPSPLHHTATMGNQRIARLLLENGVPVNRVDDRGVTALYVAVTKGHLETCVVLLQFGACYNPKGTIDGIKMREVVKKHQPVEELFKKIYEAFRLAKDGDVKLLELLRQLKIPSSDEGIVSTVMNCVDNNGFTLLGAALHFNHMKLAEELMAFRI